MSERILCAAIYVDDGQPHGRSHAYPGTGLMFCGWRHADCFAAMSAWGATLTDDEREACNHRDAVRAGDVESWTAAQTEAARRDLRGFDQGFLTSTGRYVSREEGYQIAQAAGQVVRSPSNAGRLARERPMLISEDLY